MNLYKTADPSDPDGRPIWINARGEVFTSPNDGLPKCHIWDYVGFSKWQMDVLREAKKLNDQPLQKSEVDKAKQKLGKKTAESIKPTEPVLDDKEYACSDLGNVERFVRDNTGQIYYIIEERGWRIWDGARWSPDPCKAEISKRIDDTVRSIYLEAGLTSSLVEREKISRWAQSSESKTRRTAILSDAEHRREFIKSINDFDIDPWALNVLNGTVDLKSGKLLPHTPDMMITKMAPVIFEPDAKCPTWESTLKAVFQENPAIIGYIQRVAGYTLTGVSNERSIFFLYGRGRNGKSTITETIFEIMGDYGRRVNIASLMTDSRRNAGGPSEDIARLNGARFVLSSEAADGQRLNESLIKDLSGGDRMNARFLNCNSFDFKPVLKLWMFGNYKPRVRGQDTGIKDRMKMIPFVHTFENPDKGMIAKLQAEKSGILNWIIAGCLEWKKNGLQEPAIINQSTEEYFLENDPVGQFLTELCRINKEFSTRLSDLYEAFQKHPEAGNITKRFFVRSLRDNHGLETIQGPHNVTFVRGVALNWDDEIGYI